MKIKNSILLALFSFISLNSFGQTENFSVQNNYITWSMEFSSKLSKEQLQDKISESVVLREMSSLKGRTRPMSKNCESKLTAIFMRNEFDCFVRITPSEKGYKVTIDDIRFFSSETLRLGAMETTDKQSPIESYLVRKKDNTLRKNRQAQTDLNCLNQTFNNLFQFISEE